MRSAPSGCRDTAFGIQPSLRGGRSEPRKRNSRAPAEHSDRQCSHDYMPPPDPYEIPAPDGACRSESTNTDPAPQKHTQRARRRAEHRSHKVLRAPLTRASRPRPQECPEAQTTAVTTNITAIRTCASSKRRANCTEAAPRRHWKIVQLRAPFPGPKTWLIELRAGHAPPP